jgi:hypothetical protein
LLERDQRSGQAVDPAISRLAFAGHPRLLKRFARRDLETKYKTPPHEASSVQIPQLFQS